MPSQDVAGHRRGLGRAGGRDDDRPLDLPGRLSLSGCVSDRRALQEAESRRSAGRPDGGPAGVRSRPGDLRAGRRRPGRALARPRPEDAPTAPTTTFPRAGIPAEPLRAGWNSSTRCVPASSIRARSTPWRSAPMAGWWRRRARTRRSLSGAPPPASSLARRSVIRRRSEPLAFSPDGRTLLSGCDDGLVRLWDVEDACRVRPANSAIRSSVLGVAFSPDGRKVLTGSTDKTARLWDVGTGEPIGPPMTHTDFIDGVAFSPDGRTVLTASWDRTARLWDASTGEPIGQPMTHDDWVSSVAYSPDGRTILTGSYDRTARLWDAATCQPIGESDPSSALRRRGGLQPGREADPHRLLRRHGPPLGGGHRPAARQPPPPSAHRRRGGVQPRRPGRADRQLRPLGAALGGRESRRPVIRAPGFHPGVLFSPDGSDHPHRERGSLRRGSGMRALANRSGSHSNTAIRWKPSPSVPTAAPY